MSYHPVDMETCLHFIDELPLKRLDYFFIERELIVEQTSDRSIAQSGNGLSERTGLPAQDALK